MYALVFPAAKCEIVEVLLLRQSHLVCFHNLRGFGRPLGHPTLVSKLVHCVIPGLFRLFLHVQEAPGKRTLVLLYLRCVLLTALGELVVGDGHVSRLTSLGKELL